MSTETNEDKAKQRDGLWAVAVMAAALTTIGTAGAYEMGGGGAIAAFTAKELGFFATIETGLGTIIYRNLLSKFGLNKA